MALFIEAEAEQLAKDIARATGVTPEEAVFQALSDHKQRLASERAARVDAAWHYLEAEVWPKLPPEVLGKSISKEEREDILGYGPNGV